MVHAIHNNRIRPIILNPMKATIFTLKVPIYAEDRRRKTTGSNRR